MLSKQIGSACKKLPGALLSQYLKQQNRGITYAPNFVSRGFSYSNKGASSEFFKLSISKQHASCPNSEQSMRPFPSSSCSHYINGSDYSDEAAAPIISAEILEELKAEERQRKMER